ncbi:MAG: hypothetical protein ABFD82_12355 [Syntrophaceae bacterium]
MGDEKTKAGLKIVLFQERGPTSRFIDAEVDENGKLIVSGQDVGEAPRQWFGDDDYEFFVTVDAGDKDRVLLALIDKVFGGNFSAVDEFREFLEGKGIPFGWMTW